MNLGLGRVGGEPRNGWLDGWEIRPPGVSASPRSQARRRLRRSPPNGGRFGRRWHSKIAGSPTGWSRWSWRPIRSRRSSTSSSASRVHSCRGGNSAPKVRGSSSGFFGLGPDVPGRVPDDRPIVNSRQKGPVQAGRFPRGHGCHDPSEARSLRNLTPGSAARPFRQFMGR